ncbi:cilia- and flagella-associated protein HOATZ [Pseudoliparis swirei]|uniref:cilia- and flagella-associated protein HOATZ n=1 Tax=Pseudoliparis swirei TaxID=2059687 RepID=UPI0024BEE479|nr:cilia- and flagella-associated protein HOATZ [Pseudoliparis swirei]
MCSPEPEDVEPLVTVFQGSSPEHAAHARLLWSSMSLLPPLESRLLSAEDTRQRLPVSRPQHPRAATPPPPEPPEERRRYAAMADQRRETMALLRRQRDQRVRGARRERLPAGGQPGTKLRGGTTAKEGSPADCELVEQLQ